MEINFIHDIVKQHNESVKQKIQNNPEYKVLEEIWLNLQKDVFMYGLIAEFCDFYLEYPELNIIEIDRIFRNEWDI